MTHSVSLKCAARVTVFLKEISGAALLTQKLWPMIYLWKATSLLCIREDVCVLCRSPDSCRHRRELRACTLRWSITLITSCKMSLSSGDIFRLASISLWVTQCIDSHSEVTSLTRVVKPESRPVTAATPSVHMTRNDQFSFPDMSKT